MMTTGNPDDGGRDPGERILFAGQSKWKSARTDQMDELRKLVRERDMALSEQRARHVKESIEILEQRRALASGHDFAMKISKLFGWGGTAACSGSPSQVLPDSPTSTSDAAVGDVQRLRDECRLAESATDLTNVESPNKTISHSPSLSASTTEQDNAATERLTTVLDSKKHIPCPRCERLQHELEVALTDRTLAEVELVSLRRMFQSPDHSGKEENRTASEHTDDTIALANGRKDEAPPSGRECSVSFADCRRDSRRGLREEQLRLETILSRTGCVAEQQSCTELRGPETARSSRVTQDDQDLAKWEASVTNESKAATFGGSLSAAVSESARYFEELTKRRLLRRGAEADLCAARAKIAALLLDSPTDASGERVSLDSGAVDTTQSGVNDAMEESHSKCNAGGQAFESEEHDIKKDVSEMESGDLRGGKGDEQCHPGRGAVRTERTEGVRGNSATADRALPGRRWPPSARMPTTKKHLVPTGKTESSRSVSPLEGAQNRGTTKTRAKKLVERGNDGTKTSEDRDRLFATSAADSEQLKQLESSGGEAVCDGDPQHSAADRAGRGGYPQQAARKEKRMPSEAAERILVNPPDPSRDHLRDKETSKTGDNAQDDETRAGGTLRSSSTKKSAHRGKQQEETSSDTPARNAALGSTAGATINVRQTLSPPCVSPRSRPSASVSPTFRGQKPSSRRKTSTGDVKERPALPSARKDVVKQTSESIATEAVVADADELNSKPTSTGETVALVNAVADSPGPHVCPDSHPSREVVLSEAGVTSACEPVAGPITKQPITREKGHPKQPRGAKIRTRGNPASTCADRQTPTRGVGNVAKKRRTASRAIESATTNVRSAISVQSQPSAIDAPEQNCLGAQDTDVSRAEVVSSHDTDVNIAPEPVSTFPEENASSFDERSNLPRRHEDSCVADVKTAKLEYVGEELCRLVSTDRPSLSSEFDAGNNNVAPEHDDAWRFQSGEGDESPSTHSLTVNGGGCRESPVSATACEQHGPCGADDVPRTEGCDLQRDSSSTNPLRIEVEMLRLEKAELEDTIAHLNVAAAQLYFVEYAQMKKKCLRLQRVVMGTAFKPDDKACRYGHESQEVMFKLKMIGVNFFRRRIGGVMGERFFPKGLQRALDILQATQAMRGCQTVPVTGLGPLEHVLGGSPLPRALTLERKSVYVQVAGGIDAEDEPLMEQQVYALLGRLDLLLKRREDTLLTYNREAEEGAREARALLASAAAQQRQNHGWGSSSRVPDVRKLVGGREGPAGAPRPALNPTNLLFTAAVVLDSVGATKAPLDELKHTISPTRVAADGRVVSTGSTVDGYGSRRHRYSPADNALLELSDEIVAALESEQRRSDASAERRRFASEAYSRDHKLQHHSAAGVLGQPVAGVPPLIWGMGLHLVGKLAKAFRAAVEARSFEREVADADLVAAVTLGRSSSPNNGGGENEGPPWHLGHRMLSAVQTVEDGGRGERSTWDGEKREKKEVGFDWGPQNYTHFRCDRPGGDTLGRVDGIDRDQGKVPVKSPSRAKTVAAEHANEPYSWRSANDDRAVRNGHGGAANGRGSTVPASYGAATHRKSAAQRYRSAPVGTRKSQQMRYPSPAAALVEAAVCDTVKPSLLHRRPASASMEGRYRIDRSGYDVCFERWGVGEHGGPTGRGEGEFDGRQRPQSARLAEPRDFVSASRGVRKGDKEGGGGRGAVATGDEMLHDSAPLTQFEERMREDGGVKASRTQPSRPPYSAVRPASAGGRVIDTRLWSSEIAPKTEVFRCRPQTARGHGRFEQTTRPPPPTHAGEVPTFLIRKERQLAERELAEEEKAAAVRGRFTVVPDNLDGGHCDDRVKDSGGCVGDIGYRKNSVLSSARLEESMDGEGLLPDAGEQAFFDAWKPAGYGHDLSRYD